MEDLCLPVKTESRLKYHGRQDGGRVGFISDVVEREFGAFSWDRVAIERGEENSGDMGSRWEEMECT